MNYLRSLRQRAQPDRWEPLKVGELLPEMRQDRSASPAGRMDSSWGNRLGQLDSTYMRGTAFSGAGLIGGGGDGEGDYDAGGYDDGEDEGPGDGYSYDEGGEDYDGGDYSGPAQSLDEFRDRYMPRRPEEPFEPVRPFAPAQPFGPSHPFAPAQPFAPSAPQNFLRVLMGQADPRRRRGGF